MTQENQDNLPAMRDIAHDSIRNVSYPILALSAGLLALDSIFLLDHKASAVTVFELTVAALALLAASLLCALWCVVNSYREFLGGPEHQDDHQIPGVRRELFWFQNATFAAGATYSVIAVIILALQK